MMDSYQVPTLILLWLLAAVFAVLSMHHRTWRRQLWLAGWLLIAVQMLTSVLGHGTWLSRLVFHACGMLGPLMFLGSLAAPFFGQKRRISWVGVFAVPAMFYVVSASLSPNPGFLLYVLQVLAAAATALVALAWSFRPQLLPSWATIGYAVLVGMPCLCFAVLGKPQLTVTAAQAGMSIWAAVLVGAVYRRFSTGVMFTAGGLVLWQLVPLPVQFLPLSNGWATLLLRGANLASVMAAVGMIVLVLEDQDRDNALSQRRDRRARREMERYAGLSFATAPHENFGQFYQAAMEAIVETSGFTLAAVLLRQVSGRVQLAAVAGVSPGQAASLERIAGSVSDEELLKAWDEMQCRRAQSPESCELDLSPWMATEDTEWFESREPLRAVGISTPAGGLQGVLLLGERQQPGEPFVPEDLMPLQLMAARMAAALDSVRMLRRVEQSERLAGVGRLAGGIAHELNNPLTVVMGYAEIMEEVSNDDRTRQYAGVIRRESQRMRQVVEGLARFWRPSPSPVVKLDVASMVRSLERETRAECERQGVQVEVTTAAGLPAARTNADRLEQVLRQLVANAMQAAATDSEDRLIRIEAAQGKDHLRIVVSNSGAGFTEPERLFDPFATLKPQNEGAGLAMSLCYSMIRELGGDMSAYNLQPRGAAVVLELPMAVQDPEDTFAAHVREA